ncbi:MAG: hypothetical protein J6Q05_01900 [Elusimicrobiaceae bacterium]|nr:hypothetical protein [Elusimicrobiaceae bacterium]
MKKFLFLLLLSGSLYACTTPEEDAQIKLFWFEQLMQIMPQQARPTSQEVQPFPVIMDEEKTEPPALEEEETSTQLPETQETQPVTAPEQNAPDTVVKNDSKKITVAQRPQGQFLEITMEDVTRNVNQFKNNAPLKERQAMQRAIENVKQSNQQALRDIGTMFDGDTQAQAFSIISKSEKVLLRLANTSTSYENYLNAQRKILQEQDAQLNQLMRANAYKLRRVRG